MQKQDVYMLIEKHYRDRHRAMVQFIARMGVKDYHEQQDVVQEAISRCLKFWDKYDPKKGKMSTWVESVLRNTARDFKQTERNKGMGVCPESVDADELLDMAIDIEEQVIAEQELALIQDEINKLDPVRKDIVQGFLILGHSAKELAGITGWSENAVWKAVQRFRDSLGPRHALGS